ncbi:MAG TPA: hypothetical protein VFC46_14600 [Humisphaera sp.]|nr:hypothetical protein [Humisphaera sp.]
MNSHQSNRIQRELTPEERDRLQRQRALIAEELPDLGRRDKMTKEAHEEPTLTGEIRRGIHASGISVAAIASRAGITPLQLDEFLTGERTLRSDVLDRLAMTIGFRFQPMTSTKQ